MNNKFIKPLALCICAGLIIGGVGVTVRAVHDQETDSIVGEPSVVLETTQSNNLVKDETVYVLAGADGSVQKIIVSDWIKNSLSAAEVADRSELAEIETVKEDTTYTLNADNMRVWDAQGNDIYYRGNIDKELPVKLTVSYQLNGKPISAEELAGKSGKVTLRFDYQNTQYKMVTINGKQEKIYVPFAMLTGLLLDSQTFRNVEVSNGKLVNDGSHLAVIGFALPGLQENLQITDNLLQIPDFVEITADVTNFQMTNTMTIATNGLFNQLNTEPLDSAEDLTRSLDELNLGMKQLLNGSSALYAGLCTLLEKSDILVNGILQLTEGAAALQEGSGFLKTGAAALAEGSKELNTGLGQLTEKNKDLTAGSKQIFESLLAMANTQISAAGVNAKPLTIENYTEVLNDMIASLDTDNIAEQVKQAAKESVTREVYAQKDAVTAAVTASVKEEVTVKVTDLVQLQVETQVLSAMNMTKDEYEAGVAAGKITEEQQTKIAAAVKAQMQSEPVQSTIHEKVQEQMQSASISVLITTKTDEQLASLIEQNMNSTAVQSKITAALETAKSSAASISALKEQLDSYNTFYKGLNQYTAGVAAAKDGANQLQAGAVQLENGAAELQNGTARLYDGILSLKNGVPTLVDGVAQLKNGAMQLSNGLQEFNEKGVQKLTNAVEGDMKILLTRIKATIDVSKEYKSFSGLSNDMQGNVKFIYRTESIEGK